MRHKKNMLSVALFLAFSSPVFGQELPPGVLMVNAAEAKWEKLPTGEQLKVIGDPSKPGPYMFLLKPRPGPSSSTQPHTHPDTRTYTVLSGTWYIGFGPKFDESKLMALPAGSYYTEPAGVPHFVLIKDEGVMVKITGTGPSRQVPFDAAQK
jgi:hypothetical protein